MAASGNEIIPVNIEDELRQSYLDYAMSVIVGRALPDVRDGLKPVHRRVLFAMSELNNTFNRPYVKSARVVGDVIGKYHPHGDSAVYETIVRLAQDFSMRYMLVDGQGNFGSIDGDPPAAMRYTEVRMAKISRDLLADLDKETVDHQPNYDETLQMPAVLPTRIPNLLVNGASGIAVGMATNIPPHNLTEVINACLAVMDDPDITIDGLMAHVTGPDFPTAGIINGRAGIVEAYRTGRGRIRVRARATIEPLNAQGTRDVIIVSELPYQVNKARLIERIAELVKAREIEGISEIRDESDKDGLRIVIEVGRDKSGEVVLNNLLAKTQMETVFGINCVALVAGEPRTVNLKQMIELFINHRREVVTRRSVYLLRKARERGHVLEGLAVALSNIDAVIELIRKSQSAADARAALVARAWTSEAVAALLARTGAGASRPEGLDPAYGFRDGSYYLTEVQAQAILDLRLHRLTALEQDQLINEYGDILAEIADLQDILSSDTRLGAVIRAELREVVEEYGDARRTEIIESQDDLTDADLIPEEQRVVTLSHAGYAKTQPLSDWQAQHRGGMGKQGTQVRDEDSVAQLIVTSSHDTLMCFTNLGRIYWVRVLDLPSGGRGAAGRPIQNLISLTPGERVTTILPAGRLELDGFVFMATADGTVKKTPTAAFARQRSAGLIAIALEDGNTLIGAAITNGHSDVMLLASNGKAARFPESDVRAMGRTARGVRGIRLRGNHRVLALIIPAADAYILTVGAGGMGKRTPVSGFPTKGRGSQGVIAMKTGGKVGDLVGAVQVWDNDELMLISDQGTLLRTRVSEVSVRGRITSGVKVFSLRDNERLVAIERIADGDAGDVGDVVDAAGPAGEPDSRPDIDPDHGQASGDGASPAPPPDAQ